eukprot:2320623-Amphidinium_carterae.1
MHRRPSLATKDSFGKSLTAQGSSPRSPTSPRNQKKWKRLSSLLSEETSSCEAVSALQIAEERRGHVSSGMLVLFYFLFGQLVGKMRGWTPIDAFYCTVVTFTTVGFGDFNFSSGAHGHFLLGAVFISTGVVVFGYVLSQEFTGFMQLEEDNVRFRA